MQHTTNDNGIVMINPSLLKIFNTKMPPQKVPSVGKRHEQKVILTKSNTMSKSV